MSLFIYRYLQNITYLIYCIWVAVKTASKQKRKECSYERKTAISKQAYFISVGGIICFAPLQFSDDNRTNFQRQLLEFGSLRRQYLCFIDTEVYKLYMVDDIETDLEGMPAYAKNIIEYADNLENSNIFNLYVIGNRCFFDIHDSRGMRKKYTSTVFEYFPDDNSVKRIVQFKDYYTQYVELY